MRGNSFFCCVSKNSVSGCLGSQLVRRPHTFFLSLVQSSRESFSFCFFPAVRFKRRVRAFARIFPTLAHFSSRKDSNHNKLRRSTLLVVPRCRENRRQRESVGVSSTLYECLEMGFSRCWVPGMCRANVQAEKRDPVSTYDCSVLARAYTILWYLR